MPKGELPRHMQLYCDRYLTDKVVPGNRVTVMGVYSIRKAGFKSAKVLGWGMVCCRAYLSLSHPRSQSSRDKATSAGLRRPYLRVVGIEVESEGPGRAGSAPLTPQEEEELRRLAARPDVYDIIARSIAPSIYGSIGE